MLINTNPNIISGDLFQQIKTAYNHLNLMCDVYITPIEKVSKNLGYVNAERTNNKPSYRVLVWRHDASQSLLKTIIHELIHIDQIETGRLKIDFKGNKTWSGDYYESGEPWEAEAERISGDMMINLFSLKH